MSSPFIINPEDAERLKLKFRVPGFEQGTDIFAEMARKLRRAVEIAQDYLGDRYEAKTKQVGKLIRQRALVKGEDIFVAGIGMSNETDPFASPVIILAATVELMKDN